MNKELLIDTLSLLGVKDIPDEVFKNIISHSPPSPENYEQTEQVYREANRRLLELTKSIEVPACVHLTSVMRALMNSNHRSTYKQIWHKVETPASFVGHWQKGEDFSIAKFVRTNRKYWRDFTWKQLYDAFDMVSRGVAELNITDDVQNVQYSLFGSEYVLLQSEHTEIDRYKDVWFIDSPKLNEILRPKINNVLNNSVRVDTLQITKFLLSISSSYSQRIIKELEAKDKEISLHKFKQSLPFDIKFEEHFNNLLAVGLIEYNEDNSCIKVTSDGSDFVKTTN